MSWTKEQVNLLSKMLEEAKKVSYKDNQLDNNLQINISKENLENNKEQKNESNWLDF